MIKKTVNKVKRKLFGPRVENKFLTIIESPYGGDFERNEQYAMKCARDSYERGEVPFASHLLYTRFMNDLVKEERDDGISFGLKIGESSATLAAVYTDFGISAGMKKGIKFWEDIGVTVEYRNIF